MTDEALSARQRRNLFVRSRLGGQKHAIAKIDAGDAPLACPVVPRFVHHIAAIVFRRPPRDRFAEELRYLALRHPFFQREKLGARDGETVDRIRHPSRRLGVRRIVRQDGAVEADRILIAADRGQLAREVELDALVDLTRAAVLGVLLHEGTQRIGVNLLLALRCLGRHGSLFMMKNAEPVVVESAAAIAARSDEKSSDNGRDDSAHLLPH